MDLPKFAEFGKPSMSTLKLASTPTYRLINLLGLDDHVVVIGDGRETSSLVVVGDGGDASSLVDGVPFGWLLGEASFRCKSLLGKDLFKLSRLERLADGLLDVPFFFLFGLSKLPNSVEFGRVSRLLDKERKTRGEQPTVKGRRITIASYSLSGSEESTDDPLPPSASSPTPPEHQRELQLRDET